MEDKTSDLGVVDYDNLSNVEDVDGKQTRARHDYLGDREHRPSILKQAAVIIVTSIIRAVEMNVFILPNKIAPGGVSGLASMFYNLWGVSASLMSFVMNIPLLILAFVYINKYFAISTLIGTGLTSIAMELIGYDVVFVDDVFVAALMGGVLSGIAMGWMFKINSSTGGTDIVGLLVQNKIPDAKVLWIIFAINAVIVAADGIVFKSLPIAIYSFISIYAGSYSAEIIQRGFAATYEVKVITNHPNQLINYVTTELKRGGTQVSAIGVYTGEEHKMLMFVVRKRQATAIKRYILLNDPEAFMYINNIQTTIGKGFYDDSTPASKIK